MEITKEQMKKFYDKFLNSCEEHYDICTRIQGTYNSYDEMLVKFIKCLGVTEATLDNVWYIVHEISRKNFISYDNYTLLLVMINHFFDREYLKKINEKEDYIGSLIAPESYLFFTNVADFISYMEPKTWVDYYIYTSLYYKKRVELAIPIKSDDNKHCELNKGDWVFDQYGNELVVSKILDGDYIEFLSTGVRLTGDLFVDYKIISSTGKFIDSCIFKPDYNKPINVKHMYVIPAQTSIHCSKIIDFKISKIKILVDREVISGDYIKESFKL